MNTRNNYLLKVALAFGLSLLLTVALVLPSQASPPAVSNESNDNPYRIEEFDINTPGDLEVKTSGGHISVEGSESNRVRVEMYVSRNGRELTPSDTDLDNFDIRIERTGNRVYAIADRKGKKWGWGRNNISISFVVYTPRKMSTNLRTSGGHIDIRGLDGDQSLRTSGGHLNLSNLKGMVEARTSGGHIEINDFTGNISGRTSGGHIQVSHAEGTIELKTSGGHINLSDLSGTIEVSTSGGSITADLKNINRFAKLRTSGGHVNITLPDGIGLDLDLKGNRVSSNLSNFNGTVERDEIEGTINGGGPKLTARTSGGAVRISYY